MSSNFPIANDYFIYKTVPIPYKYIRILKHAKLMDLGKTGFCINISAAVLMCDFYMKNRIYLYGFLYIQ